MRLVAWNSNYNNHPRSVADTVRLLDPLCADVLVVSETARPETLDTFRIGWIGDGSPGLVVIARNDLTLRACSQNLNAQEFVGAFEVTGRLDFSLLAFWPCQRDGGPSYHEILMASLSHFKDFFSRGPTLFAGDFNSNTRVSNQKQTHPEFVSRMSEAGFLSAYHEQTGEAHGEETVPTYLHGKDKKPFHIDYCFVPSRIVESVSLSVLSGRKWEARSDHFPLVIDVPDTAIAAGACLRPIGPN